MKKYKVVIFCGGSGSESIIRYFSEQKNIDLTLLINAYDDGKSTGEIRKRISGLLGPSDFRKNLSYLINFFSNEQRSLKKIFEYRIKRNISINDFYHNNLKKRDLSNFTEEFNSLNKENRDKIFSYLLISAKYLNTPDLNLKNFSLGNLIFAGIYLSEKKNFNLTVKKFSQLVDTDVKIINISDNSNRWLIGINKKNKIIHDEANLVENKQLTPIKEIYLIKKKEHVFFSDKIKNLSQKKTIELCKKIDSVPKINAEAKNSILKSDLIIYGPGTQHSSLFPSYKISNKYIKKSKAEKIMIMNLEHDNDIKNLKTKEILQQALKYLGSTKKTNNVINSVLVDKKCKFNNLNNNFKETEVKKIDIRNSLLKQKHSGKKVYDEIFKKSIEKEKKMLIFLNLFNKSQNAVEYIDQLFSENWDFSNKKIKIIINSDKKIFENKIPNLIFKKFKNQFPEVSVFKNWVKKKDYEYLITISGDGYYDISKIKDHVKLMSNSNCGLLIGSRNQSRSQHFDSIKNLYKNNKILYFISKISEFFYIFIYFLKLKFFLSDPNSSYRIYSKKNYDYKQIKNIKKTPAEILKKLVKKKIEVIEVPIKYFSDRRFSVKISRYRNTIKNLKGLLFD